MSELNPSLGCPNFGVQFILMTPFVFSRNKIHLQMLNQEQYTIQKS